LAHKSKKKKEQKKNEFSLANKAATKEASFPLTGYVSK